MSQTSIILGDSCLQNWIFCKAHRCLSAVPLSHSSVPVTLDSGKTTKQRVRVGYRNRKHLFHAFSQSINLKYPLSNININSSDNFIKRFKPSQAVLVYVISLILVKSDVVQKQ